MNPLDKDLTTLAAALEVPPEDLIAYAAEDTLGGYHSDKAQEKFPCGSLWGVEGQLLYALCRLLRPEHVVEIGTLRGASAVHILSALKQNDFGTLTTIDIVEGAGDLIPEDLMARCCKKTGRGQDLIETLDTATIVFEDAQHSADDVEQILRAAYAHLAPRIILSHDGAHPTAGPDIREGWDRVFGADTFTTFLTSPSDCGFTFKVF